MPQNNSRSSFIGNVWIKHQIAQTLHLKGVNTDPLFFLCRNWTSAYHCNKCLTHSGNYVEKYKIGALLSLMSMLKL
jgi:hypothetical protein